MRPFLSVVIPAAPAGVVVSDAGRARAGHATVQDLFAAAFFLVMAAVNLYQLLREARSDGRHEIAQESARRERDQSADPGVE